MADNLAALGFSFTDADEFQERMLELAAASVERLDCEAGAYAIWRSRTGAEVWFHIGLFGTEDSARDIVGLTPFLEGASEVALEITQRCKRPDDNAFEGAFVARLEDGGTLTFDAVDFAAHAGRALPFRSHARLTGFAVAVRIIDDEALAPAIVDAAGDHLLELTGRVVELRRVVNEATASPFCCMLLQSDAATVDIVAAPAVLAGEIAVGTHIEVACRLFGRLLD